MNVAAGKNGNRTGFSDTFDGGSPTTVAYCYDNADRLTSSTVANAPAGAGPAAGGNLSTVGPGASLAYDTHGNTTRLGDQTLSYDVADRHTKTVLDDGTVITYVWGPGGDIISRTSLNRPGFDHSTNPIDWGSSSPPSPATIGLIIVLGIFAAPFLLSTA